MLPVKMTQCVFMVNFSTPFLDVYASNFAMLDDLPNCVLLKCFN